MPKKSLIILAAVAALLSSAFAVLWIAVPDANILGFLVALQAVVIGFLVVWLLNALLSPRQFTKLMARLVILVIASALGVGVAEGLIRAFRPYNTPETIARYSLRYEPSIFSRHRMAPVGGLQEMDEGKAWGTKPMDAPSDRTYRINSVGYRAASFAVHKPEGLIRIVVLGGSAVFDPESSDTSEHEGYSWPDRVQRELEASGFGAVEVINAGVPGHASFDSLGRLHSQLWMYEPDVVVVYHAWNDMKFWKRFEIEPESPLIEKLEPYDKDRNPFIRYRGGWDRLLCHSQLYAKLRNRYLGRRLNVGLEGVIDSNAAERASSYGPWGPRQFRLDMELVVDAARDIGALPILVTQASLVSAQNTAEERERIGYHYLLLSHEALVAGMEEANGIIRSIGRDKGVPVIDAAASLTGRADLFADGVHATPKGSQALAALVADGLAPHLR